MEKTLTEICEYLNNYFWRQKIQGTFTISGGSINVPALKENQYYRILGSTFNEGVHKYPTDNLIDETFEGSIWSMAVPQTVIGLASDIKKWQEKYEDAESIAMSPFTSENYTDYSYSKSAGGADGNGSASWQAAFGSRLKPFRRLRGV